MGLIEDFSLIMGKNSEDMHRLFKVYEYYLRSYRGDQLGKLIDQTKKGIESYREETLKRQFVELESYVSGNENVGFFILKNQDGLYDIFMALGKIEVKSCNITYESVIDKISENQAQAWVIENVDRVNAERFIKAMYIRSKSNSHNNMRNEFTFKCVLGGAINRETAATRIVYFDKEILPYKLANIELPDRVPSSFEQVLDAVYSNKYYGTKIRTLK